MFAKARILCLLLSAIPALRAAETDGSMRVVLPGPERLASPTRASKFNCTLGLHLRARFQEIPSITTVSDQRMAAIMEELVSPARDQDLRDLLGAFRLFQPVDACVFYTCTGSTVRVIVQTAARRFDEGFAMPDEMPLADAVRRAAGMIGAALGLRPPDIAILTETGWKNPEDFAAYYECQCWPVPEVTATSRGPEYGDIRLARLYDQWSKQKENPRFAEQVFKNAAELGVSTRKFDFRRVNWVVMARQSLPAILGSPFEAAAYPLIQSHPGDYQDIIFDLCKPLSVELSGARSLTGLMDLDVGTSDGSVSGKTSKEANLDSMLEQAPEAKQPISFGVRQGALRALGFVGKPKALAALQEAAGHEDARVREAAAFGLSVFPSREGLPRLRKLTQDSTEAVAWAAASGIWTATGETTPGLLPLTRKLAGADGALKTDAIRVLCALGVETDLPLIRNLWSQRLRGLRRELLQARIRLNDVKDGEWAALLQDPEETIILEGLTSTARPQTDPALLTEVKRLANDPYGPVARAAREAILSLRPTIPLERARFDLEYQHPYLRKKALELLAQSAEPAALNIIESACANRDSHARATALGLLTERVPDRARPLVSAALKDPSRWVRFHAAVLLAKLADRTSAGLIEERLRAVQEPAERRYLEEALARAKGLPPLAPPAAARSVAGTRNLAWNTSPGQHADTSPFDAYYSMKTGSDANMRKAHAAGKIIFGRATPIGSPGSIILNSTARDEFWLELEQELTPDNLAVLDGLVFGEETMGMSAGGLWDDGWQVFCLEAGIAAERVKGRTENLNPSETRAWGDWAIARHVEGFNLLYDFTKLKYGKLRPGLQICTFLPADALPHPGSPEAIRSWKFDMGGVYDYKGDSRMAAYNLVRRYKTIWPERPVLWLSLGIGGYEMNPVKHTQKVPKTPMLERYDRAYSDSLTAWMAGADTGWFSTWMFVKPDFKRQGLAKLRGVQVWIEDLGPDTRLLDRGIAWSFAGVERIEEAKLAPPPPEMPEMNVNDLRLPEKGMIPEPAAEEQEKEQQESISAEVKERRLRFKEGFLFYQRYVYDCARIFASLPRLNLQPRALAVRDGVDVWTRPSTPYPLVPGQALLNEYDFLCDINMLGQADLNRYRYIVVHRPSALRDETIERITRWLKDVPGLLVVHLNLPAENDAEAGTAQDHDGRLKNDWPWEADIGRKTDGSGKRTIAPAAPLKKVTLTGPQGPLDVAQLTATTVWNITGERARAMVSRDRDCLLALWRDPKKFHGAVLFDGVQDASAEYLTVLRGIINHLHAENGIGLELKGTACAEIYEGKQIRAVAASHYYRSVRGEVQLEGLDVMTGDPKPEVSGPRHSKAALVARDYIERFIASSAKLTAVSDVPFTSARIEGDDLIVQSAGTIRVASLTGNVTVSSENTKPLPEAADAVAWLLFSKDEGIARFPQDQAGRVMTYLRSATPVRLRASNESPQ